MFSFNELFRNIVRYTIVGGVCWHWYAGEHLGKIPSGQLYTWVLGILWYIRQSRGYRGERNLRLSGISVVNKVLRLCVRVHICQRTA